jgi:hypothetical protein
MVPKELLNELNTRFDFILNEKNPLFDACYLLATALDPDLLFVLNDEMKRAILDSINRFGRIFGVYT